MNVYASLLLGVAAAGAGGELFLLALYAAYLVAIAETSWT